MNNRMSQRYTASSLDSYNELLMFILEAKLPVDINTNREARAIVLEFDDKDSSIIDKISVAAEDLKVSVSDAILIGEQESSVIAQIAQAESELKNAAENLSDLRQKNDLLTQDCDMYKKWYLEENNKSNRVKEQVKAIATLIKAIYPD